MFDQWNQGWDPYAASSPSLYKFNPARFYAEQLPVGGDNVGGAPPPGSIPYQSFMTTWWAPFAFIAFVVYMLQKGLVRGHYGVKLNAGAGAG